MADSNVSNPEIPKEHIVPMDDIAEGVRGLRIAFVNVFAVTHANGSWTLIDAGVPFSATAIRHWAERHFTSPPLAILLTHGHFDHVSAAGDLANHWDVPVYAHPLEAPYLNGQKEYPPPRAGAGGGLMSLLSPMYPRGPIDLGSRLRLFSSDAEMNELPGWQVIHSPGHTPGHVSFFRPADHTLIVGDAFCTTKPESFFDAAIAQPPELHGPPAYFTSDPAQAAQSIRALSQLHPRILAPGHGRALAGLEVEEKLTRFAAEFVAGPGSGENSVRLPKAG
jgi:glyoxylase-like metal-dependent hydrolase (beta-lactamase superfamily II)